MNTHTHVSGFTLVELVVAVSISLLVSLALFTVFSMVNKMTYAGNRQVNYNDIARKAQGKMIAIIEESRACGVQTPTFLVLTRPSSSGGLITGSLKYFDTDNNPATVSNNCIIYDPDTSVAGNEQTLCYYVSPMDGSSTVFKMLNISPATVGVTLHVGDATNTPGAGILNTGYQGFVLQFSATPRNLQWWYSL
jgi:type II secretory pathway pseudopilin PulG